LSVPLVELLPPLGGLLGGPEGGPEGGLLVPLLLPVGPAGALPDGDPDGYVEWYGLPDDVGEPPKVPFPPVPVGPAPEPVEEGGRPDGLLPGAAIEGEKLLHPGTVPTPRSMVGSPEPEQAEKDRV